MTRKMKESGVEWIGEIPEEWKCIRAKNYFVQSYTKGNNDLILLSATQNDGVIPKDQLEGVVQVKEDTDLSTFKTVHVGDYVISLRSFQGGFEMSNHEGVITPAYTVFRSKKEISDRYFKKLFKCDGFIAKINSLTVGIREGKNILYEDFANSLIPIPPLPEQHHIASFLDTKCSLIDSTIQKEREVIEKLKEYRQAVITEAVTKGIRPGVPMKDSGVEWIGEIPEGWDVIKLGLVADVQTGPFGSQLHNEDYVEEGTPIITVEHFGNNVIKHSNLPFVSDEDVIRLKKYILIVGDLVFSRVGSVDRCVLVSPEENGWLFSGRCLRVRLGNNVNKKFINYCFNKKAFREYMNLVAVGSTMPSINTSILSNVKIPIPSFEDQTSIVFHLDAKCSAIDATIQKRELAIEKLTAYKQSLIYECVTGKKEVLG